MMLGAVIIVAGFRYIISRLLDRRSGKSTEELAQDICTRPEEYDKDLDFLKSLPEQSIVRQVFRYWLELVLDSEDSDAEFRPSNDGDECMFISKSKYYVFSEGNPPQILLCDALKIPAENRCLADEIMKESNTLPAGTAYKRNDMENGTIIISIEQALHTDSTGQSPQEIIGTAIENTRQLQLDLVRRYNRLKLQPKA